MTDRRLPPVPRISRRRALRNSVLATIVAATLILGGLWVQMSLGRDPALGPKLAAAESKRRAGAVPPQEVTSSAQEADDYEGGELGDESLPSATLSVAPTPTPAPELAPVQTSTS